MNKKTIAFILSSCLVSVMSFAATGDNGPGNNKELSYGCEVSKVRDAEGFSLYRKLDTLAVNSVGQHSRGKPIDELQDVSLLLGVRDEVAEVSIFRGVVADPKETFAKVRASMLGQLNLEVEIDNELISINCNK